MKKSTMTTMASPPPPPSPSPSKGSRKTLIAVIVIVVVIVAVVVGVYLATRSGGGGTSPSVTPTPKPSAGVTPTPTATSSAGGANVAGASSLQFTASLTDSSGKSLGTYTYYAKNAGTSSLMLRIEFADSSGNNFVYIVNGALQQAWIESGGQWTDLSSSYSSQWSTWNSAYTGYANSLAAWSGHGDYSYTAPNGETIRIYSISVNPSLADALFQHS
jgi:hypothetical protein